MFRTVSVKKLFILLLTAIIALLLLFFLHGPFLDEGVEEAVVKALLAQESTTEADTVPAEGHKIIQAAENEDTLEVWAIVRTGVYRRGENGSEAIKVSDAYPVKMTFTKTEGEWILQDYRVPEDRSFFGKDMKELFPWYMRMFALMTGWFKGGLAKQMEAYAR